MNFPDSEATLEQPEYKPYDLSRTRNSFTMMGYNNGANNIQKNSIDSIDNQKI